MNLDVPRDETKLLVHSLRLGRMPAQALRIDIFVRHEILVALARYFQTVKQAAVRSIE